ncbi:TPA: hypothetical protein KUM87_003767 [Escherichia coli]|nr:hypothetical protein [Escherichia coli]EEW3565516.1 hypothetical protein [Escherichia coli]EFB2184839.1 hypothetical protein [Escherichia coli]EFJ8802585.1 hypothetical protein [Escherichia coli]EFJ9995565.1 hypothetical protein [Escherichia coli]
MKRILPLILALVAGMAQADSNSDYRAGSDFAHQIKGQGSSSIQGFKRVSPAITRIRTRQNITVA